MQMRMGIGADPASEADSDSNSTENEGVKATNIVLTDDNFAATMGEIFVNPAAFIGNELEMTGNGDLLHL